jgi:hypothetical protein
VDASAFLGETFESVAAANEYVRAKEERALAAGLSVHFMDDEGRFFERTSEGVSEIVQVGERWERLREIARTVDDPATGRCRVWFSNNRSASVVVGRHVRGRHRDEVGGGHRGRDGDVRRR